MDQLEQAEDPLALISSWERPDNCEAPGVDRVRLDQGGLEWGGQK